MSQQEESTTHCTQCGSPAAEADRFCANCGHSIDPIIAGSPEAPSLSTTPPVTTSRRKLWIVVGAIVAVALIGVVSGSIVMAQNRAVAQREAQAQDLRSVYEAVAAVDSAVTVGINQRDYSTKVQDAQAALDAYTPPDDEAKKVVTSLKLAMSDYTLANSEWNDAIVSTYSSPDEAALAERWEDASTAVVAAKKVLDSY